MAAEETIISDLTTATSISDSDYMIIEDALNTKKITAKKISDFIKLSGLKDGETAGEHATAEGVDNVARGTGSHAEGYGTLCAGSYCHTEGYAGLTNYDSSNDFGRSIVAYGEGSHAEGHGSYTLAVGDGVTEKRSVVATGCGAHAEGVGTWALENGAHSEGFLSMSLDIGGHAEGIKTTSTGRGSHSEGRAFEPYPTSINSMEDPTSISFNPNGDADIGKWIISQGEGTHAEGVAPYRLRNDAIFKNKGYTDTSTFTSTKATGAGAHAEGIGTQATDYGAHSQGVMTKASGFASCSMGETTTAEARGSFAGGINSKSTGEYAFSYGVAHRAQGDRSAVLAGYNSSANKEGSFASGYNTRAGGQYQFVIGMNNVLSGNDTYQSGDKIFIVGSSASFGTYRNSFSVTNSAVYGAGAYNSSGADYAEMFEWKDGNPSNKDRAGKFVTLDGDKLVLAKSTDDYILGVVSGNPSVCGDVFDDQWKGQYETDVFGRTIIEEVELEEKRDENGIVFVHAGKVKREKVNPNYDPTQPYIPRSSRPEWSPVGLLGKLVCIDDGTAQVNSYVTVNDDSIATAASSRTKYRVMERLDENHIRIMIL